MTDRRARALEIARNMLAPDTARKMDGDDGSDSFCADFGEIGLVSAFETLWTRPGLELRNRSMITVAMLIAMRATNELAIHVPAAVRNGVTITEIEEIIIHASGYAGFPAAATAREVAYKALSEAGMLDCDGPG